MKSMTTIALALATALTMPSAMADNETTQQPKSKCVPPVGMDCPTAKSKKAPTAAKEKAKDADKAAEEAADKDREMAAESEAVPASEPPTAIGGGPTEPPAPVPTATVTQTTTVDEAVAAPAPKESERRVRRGLGLGVFGSLGAAEEARWGMGGRIEYVLPFGLAFGGSYAVHYETEGNRTLVRPLLGEVGWSFAVVKHLEVRPMVGLGWAFVSGRRDEFVDENGRNVTARSAVTDGFDVAPGAKVSYVDHAIEIFTAPKYHFITGNNFAAIELGAGARF